MCGCFRTNINPDAPFEVIYGTGDDIQNSARLVGEQTTPIPVFLKRATSKWEYVGKYKCVEHKQDPDEAQAQAPERAGMKGILYFERVQLAEAGAEVGEGVGLEPFIDVDIDAIEGQQQLVMHLKRERDRLLVREKKNAVYREKGRVICEVCGFDFGTPHGLKWGCCEVHHLRPIGSRKCAMRTTLDDLAILCSNCHRIIHCCKPVATIHELRRLLQRDNIRSPADSRKRY